MITRFAPAPTGFLHLGHAVNALYVWGMARACGGQVLLRIEDHDRQRCRPEYYAALLEDLAWLGFQPDAPLVRQSERDAVYRSALATLVERGLVYGCTCTRQTATGNGGPVSGVRQPADGRPELRYPGTCRGRGIPLADGVGWRLRIEPGIERFDDAMCGPQAQDPSEQCGDVLLRDWLGNWTYQFAVTVDDCDQRITDVIRGIDLLPSTGRQIQISRLIGRTDPPRFTHHPLVMKSATEKLSKSDGDTGIRDLRAAGWSLADVRERAAHAVGQPDLAVG